jgi:ankyrin repeat protein
MPDGTALLINTILDGHVRLVGVLLEAGARADVADAYGNSAMAYAMMKAAWAGQKPAPAGWAEAMAALRAAGATEAGTAQVRFVLACGWGETAEAVGWLDNGVAVNGYGPAQTHGLGVAAQNGRVETVRALLGRGAEPDLVALGGWTALMAGAMMGHLGVVKALVEAGADPAVRRERVDAESTARGYALRGRHYKVAAYLAEVAARGA